jgi:purine-binding chemotaxis protein CheW
MNLLHVVFRVDSAEYALPAADVLQMESFTGATWVPGTPAYVAGVVQVRGQVIPVVDLRARFGLPSVAPTLDSRLVVTRIDDRTVALLVDSAREVLNLPPAQIRPPPRLVEERAEGFVKAVAHIGSRILLLVDARKVIGEEPIHER